jgi:hypothetical protein
MREYERKGVCSVKHGELERNLSVELWNKLRFSSLKIDASAEVELVEAIPRPTVPHCLVELDNIQHGGSGW